MAASLTRPIRLCFRSYTGRPSNSVEERKSFAIFSLRPERESGRMNTAEKRKVRLIALYIRFGCLVPICPTLARLIKGCLPGKRRTWEQAGIEPLLYVTLAE